ncbi:uncharacterized protein F4822DRAFT_445778 [Hypoxylon trugodes]|uniref:uncharacterized protein n=1 Tax=Hypoxylon trugodes TaxID=326681 RepID=UPI00219418AF|nr:uncharacterized protein F4822DRAFT_445778 [Hypoxylon trugodes]KAI1385971.1 hypothetical protein F4822DRAFT_445778 [Hypoxylon trugodes]
MANQEWSKLIREHPIRNGLDTCYNSLKIFYETKGISYSAETLTQLNSEDLQNVILDLLLALQQLRVSRLLRSGNKTLLANLFTLASVVASGNFDFNHVKLLVTAVITKKPDEEIWAQVYHAVTMGSLVNSSERRVDTDPVLKEELEQTYVDVPRFHDAFFEKIPHLESTSQAILERCYEGPNPWFHSTAACKLDVGIVTLFKALLHWSQVLIPGELKSNSKNDCQTGAWFDIGKYVREVFATQDIRCFVLVFTLCGSLMCVWEFDCFGGIALMQFDINKDGLRFVSTMFGFLWMDEKDLGFDLTFIPFNDGRCIEIIRNGIPECIVINKFMGRLSCIVGQVTTCWKAYPEGDLSTIFIIKDSIQKELDIIKAFNYKVKSLLSNRIYRRIIVCNYGQNIYKVSLCVALFAVFESCIQGHKLLLKAGIFHRDILINNIMINEDGSSPLGFLIDLNLAIKGKTGIRAFMAIGVLRGRQHFFEHDLESFFWVLFWICVYYNGLNEERSVPEFDKWNVVGMSELARLKSGTILDEDLFIETLIQYCTPYYKPLIS